MENSYNETETMIKNQPYHGRITSPESRAVIYLAGWKANGLESGKFFPATQAGLKDLVAPSDEKNSLPPKDGQIASAGNDFAAMLDEVKDDWHKHRVKSGQEITFSWNFSARHKTRRYNYFMTQANWNPAEKLTRAQFENIPFVKFEEQCQPHWSCDNLLPTDPTEHPLVLPVRKDYQVLLAVWEVADTGNAFYQVVDLLFD